MRDVGGSPSQIGNIYVTDLGVSYNTGSDYRLKANVVNLTSALERLAQLPARRFEFTASPGVTVDGLIAHEAQIVVPEAVTGAKDAEEDIGTATPAQGADLPILDIPSAACPTGWTWAKTGTRPIYQGIDQSKLVPLLWAAVQELAAKVAALESASG